MGTFLFNLKCRIFLLASIQTAFFNYYKQILPYAQNNFPCAVFHKHTITHLCHTEPLDEVPKNLFLIICFALHLELTASAPYFINYNNKHK